MKYITDKAKTTIETQNQILKNSTKILIKVYN